MNSSGASVAVVEWVAPEPGTSGGPDREDRFQTVFVSRDTHLRNADEIAGALDADADLPLARLLARAWARWGAATADRLRGAFAFALHDALTGEVLLARDVFGLAPLYYATSRQNIVIGDSSRAVRLSSPDSFEIDDTTVANFVAGRGPDSENTFYVGLRRFPAAHWGRVSADETVLARYWDPASLPLSTTESDAVPAFRRLFDASVRSACESGRAALLLSGGLDSSSIAASVDAQDLLETPLPCLAMTYDDTPGWSDKRHLAEMASHIGANVTTFPSDAWSPLADMAFWIEAMDGPFLPRGHSVSSRLLFEARDLGYAHILSGHGGDEIVSQGFGRINELAREGRWLALWREARGAAELYGDNRWAIISPYLSHNKLVRRVRRKLGRLSTAKPGPADDGFVSPALATTLKAQAKRTESPSRSPDHDDRMLQAHALSSPIQALSLEIIAICSRAAGIRTHMPFYDRDLAEHSLGLASHWKLRRGQTRYILRAAMGDRLPKGVRGRATKFDFSENFRRGLFADTARLLAMTDPDATSVARYVNIDRLDALRADVEAGRTDFPRPEIYFLWRVAMLGLWLAKIENEDAVAQEASVRGATETGRKVVT